MLLFLRFILIVITSHFRARLDFLETSVVQFRALPNDCDLNLHLNAGRFVSFMDIARVELLARFRVFVPLIRRGWRPILAGALVRYRRSILPFERFEIRTRVLGWDEKWFYIEHLIEKEGTHCASGYMRGTFRGPNGSVTPREVVALLNPDLISPPLPELVVRWCAVEEAR